jgi:parallel beta-helix repeat protein
MRRGSLSIPLLVSIIATSLFLGRMQIAHGTDVDPADGVVKGVWRIVDSPFHVRRDVYIPADESLTIEPGVSVYFYGPRDDGPLTETLKDTSNVGSTSAKGAIRAYRFTAEKNAVGVKIGFKVASGTGNISAALYADSGGLPGALLGESMPTTASTGWNDLVIITSVRIVAGAYYWVALQCDSDSLRFYEDPNPDICKEKAQPYGPFPNPFGTPGSTARDIARRITYFYGLSVQGRLLAVGTPGNRITFSWREGGGNRTKWGGIYLGSATRASTISYCVITNAIIAIGVCGSSNNVLTFNTIRYNSAGIAVTMAEGNTITDNEIYENSEYAVSLWRACKRNEISRNAMYRIDKGDGVIVSGGTTDKPMNTENKIKDNTVYECYLSGVRLDHVENLEITGNTIYGNYRIALSEDPRFTGGGILLRLTGDPFLEYENKNVLISNNRIHSHGRINPYRNGTGIFIVSGTDIRITYNDIYLNSYTGIAAAAGANLLQVHHNNIRNNGRAEAGWPDGRAGAVDNGTTNKWDDGSRGNFWSAYNGTDRDNDGIGDRPHVLNGTRSSKDNFPLMGPSLFMARTISTTTTVTSTSISTSYALTTTRIETTTTAATTTLHVTSISYIWTISAGSTETRLETITTSTSTTTTATTVSTWLSTTSQTLSTTTTVTTTETQTTTPRRCFIASAAYGSDISPQVEYLRQFRDHKVAYTYAGSNFMKIFNAFYYSFSPKIASLVSTSPVLAATVRILMLPLVEILRLASLIASHTIFPAECGLVVAGVTASGLIGMAYLGPFATIASWLSRRRKRNRNASARCGERICSHVVTSNGLVGARRVKHIGERTSQAYSEGVYGRS